MERRRTDLVDEFVVEADDGRRLRIREYQEVIETEDLSGGIGEVRGLKRLETEDGGAVNVLGDDLYELVQGGQRARRLR